MRPIFLIALIPVALGFQAAIAAALPADTGLAWDLSPASITASCKQQINQTLTRIAAVDARAAQDPRPALMQEIERATADMGDALAAQLLLMQIAVNKDVRDASTHCNDDVQAFGVKISSDPVIFSLAQRAMTRAATPAERRLAQAYKESGSRTGAGLPPDQRAQVTRLFDQLNLLQTAFSRALAEDHSAIRINRREAESLSPAFIKTLKPTGDGYEVGVNEATEPEFMKIEQSAAARRRFQLAYDTRGGQMNVERLTDAVALRARIATLLGFKSWAAFQLDAKMAKSPERVLELLRKVDSGSLAKARAEIAVLAELKRASGDTTEFAPWDYSFYEYLLEKNRYAVDSEAVRQYFPVRKVISAVFGIYEKLLGVHFDEIKPAQTWAPGVTEYSISDKASGAPIAWFFLDLYPRQGKYDHVAMFPIRAGRVMPDGTFQRPISAIIGNWPVGEPGKPALLSHSEVTTFFHEFGHLMHQSLSRAPFESLFGTNVRQDFVEAPSQMLENWMWQPDVLKEVSSNVKTGEPIPDALIQKMIAAEHVGDGMKWSTQAFYASYDMQLHSSGATVHPTALWFELKPQLTPFKEVSGTFPEAAFGHLMSGYDAGYYGYLWSLVYAQDMFSAFESAGVENPAVGMRYRKEILEQGALAEPDVLLRKFLGRDVSYRPFYKYIGVSPP